MVADRDHVRHGHAWSRLCLLWCFNNVRLSEFETSAKTIPAAVQQLPYVFRW